MKSRFVKKIYRNYQAMKQKRYYRRLYKTQSREDIDDILKSSGEWCLFLTNDNNGGTRQFERNYIQKHKNIIVLRRCSYGERADIIYELLNVNSGKKIYLYLEELRLFWKEMKFNKIIVNTFVHNSNIEYFIEQLTLYHKEHKTCNLIYMVHDYHSICVNCNLFVKDHFCDLKCEKEHCKLYIADNKVDIYNWRNLWNAFLDVCDEVRCFSLSSKQLMLQAYPSLQKKITVIPHDTSYIHFTPIVNLANRPFHLGVIGNCSTNFKGQFVVKELIERYGNCFPITLIGSDYRYYKIKRKFVKYTGPYQNEELQHIIMENGITHILFPSLWPETFSYLISELMAMNIPVICFNLGAQAEKMRNYKYGTIIEDTMELWEHLDRNAK